MARGNVIVTVVDVGQGQCTFVEIWNTANTKIVETLLFDCGTDKSSDETYTNLNEIAAKVLTMDTPGFNCIFFSHSDKDHISLTWYLLDKINETKKPVVSKVWYGGSWNNYTKSGFNILNYLVNAKYCSASNMYAPPSNYTSYNSTTRKFGSNYFWQSTGGDVKVVPVAANVISDDPDWDEEEELEDDQTTAEEKNRVSIVCGLYYAGSCYVICGDATAKTMAAIGGLMYGTTEFNGNKMLTLPHHGSRATGFAVSSSQQASAESIKVVDTFVKTMKAKTCTISAYQKHHHPSLELINRFIPTVTTPILRDARLKQKNTHRVTAYFDQTLTNSSGMPLTKNQVYSFETTINTFSTRYFDGYETVSYQLGTSTINASQGTVSPTTAINGFACWLFTNTSGGITNIEGRANLSSVRFTSNTVSSSAVAVTRSEELPTGFFTVEVPEVAPEVPQVAVRSRNNVHHSVVRPPASNRRNVSHFTH